MKTFVEQQDASGKIDDSYNAMVADRDEISRIIREENNRLTNVVIILQVTFVIFVATLTVAILLLRRYTNFTRKRGNGKKCDTSKNIQQKSTIISISIMTFHFLIYILVLDGVALYNRQNPPDPEISAIYRNEEPGDPFSVFYNLPLLIITFDAAVTIFSFMMLFIALLCCSFRYFKPEMDFGKKWVLFLQLSAVGLILVLLMHAPLISNAYLHDAFHASSVFIYYSAAIMIGFLLLKKVAIHTCLSSVWQAKHAKWEKPMKDTKITLHQGTLKVKKNGGSGIAQTVQLVGGNLILACDEAIHVRKQFITLNENHITVKEGQLILSNNKANFKSTDSIEELYIEEGNLQVKHATAQWSHGDEEAAIDVECGTKIKLAKGGTLKVSYEEANGECRLVLQEGKLVGKEPRCMCCTKCLNSVPGAATCFISATIIMILLFLSLLGVLAFYFVLIPINMSISNAADRLVGIYQSLFVIVGALFAYKTLFKSPEPSGIEAALTERKKPLTEGAQGAQWASLSDKEKLNEFYGIVVDTVAQYYYRNAKPGCNEEALEIDTVNV